MQGVKLISLLPKKKIPTVAMETYLKWEGPNPSLVWPMLDKNRNNVPGINDSLLEQSYSDNETLTDSSKDSFKRGALNRLSAKLSTTRTANNTRGTARSWADQGGAPRGWWATS